MRLISKTKWRKKFPDIHKRFGEKRNRDLRIIENENQ